MTNEQAKKMIKAKLECLKRETSGTDFDCNNSNCDECSLCYEQGNMGEQKEALDMAIKALEQLTSAQPERQKGKWIAQKGGGYRCSECKHYALDERDGNFIYVSAKSKFCPYCGADMRGEQDG